MDGKTITSILGIVGMVGAGGYWTWLKIIKPVISFVKRYERLEKGVDGLESMKAYSEYIDKKVDGCIYISDHPLFICNREGLCILANAAICELFGASEKQMKGFGWLNFLHPDDKEKALAIWEQAIHNGGNDVKASYRIVHGVSEEIIQATYHAVISRNEIGEVIVSVGKAYKKPKP